MALIAVLKLFRFPLVFTAVADSAAGYLIALQGRVDPLSLLLLAVSSGGLYCFGMAMNDIADLERDRQIHPDRMLPSGKLTRKHGVIASLVVLAISAAAIAAMPDAPLMRLAIWGAVVLLILAYDFFLKWPPLMGLIRAFNFLMGVSCAGHFMMLPEPLLMLMLLLAGESFLYVTSLTAASTFEERSVYEPFPTLRFGACILGMILATLAFPVLGPLCYGEHFIPVPFRGAMVSLLLSGWIAVRAWRIWLRIVTKERPAAIKLLVRDGVAGIILVDVSMMLTFYTLLVPGLAVAALIIPAALGVWGFKKLA